MFTSLGTHRVVTATGSGMVTEYYFTWGGHALTSLKGGRPCSLSTLNHVVQCKRGPVVGTGVLLAQSKLLQFIMQ